MIAQVTIVPGAFDRPTKALGDLGQNLLQFFMQRESLDLRKQQLQQQKKEFELRMQQHQAEQMAQASPAQALLAQLAGGAPQAQQIAAQVPGIAQAAQSTADANVESGAAQAQLAALGPQVEAARGRVERETNIADARRVLERVGGQELLDRFEIITKLDAAGIDTSAIREVLPPTEKEELEIQQAKLKIQDSENLQQADGFATTYLTDTGLLPEGTPLIPGAGATLLDLIRARHNKAIEREIDWVQEGVDYITARVGDVEELAALGPDATPEEQFARLMGAGASRVDVATAAQEWADITARIGPQSVATAAQRRVESGMLQNRARRERRAFAAAGALRSGVAAEDVKRDLLDAGVSPEEVAKIMQRASALSAQPRP